MIIIGGPSEVSKHQKLSPDGLDGSRYFKFDKSQLPLYKSAVDTGEDIAVIVSDIKELIFACNVGVAYVVANKEDAPIMQKIIDSYLFDTKLLAIIYDEEVIEWAAVAEIDGVVIDEDETL